MWCSLKNDDEFRHQILLWSEELSCCANLWPDWILRITVTAQRIVMRLSDEHIMLHEMVPWPVFSGWLLESPENELATCGCIQAEARSTPNEAGLPDLADLPDLVIPYVDSCTRNDTVLYTIY